MPEQTTAVVFQVAHFYNTIDQQMIPSQRPMMLSLALAFERVIKVPHKKILPKIKKFTFYLQLVCLHVT